MLNGGTVKLGTVSDVIDKIHGRRNWEIELIDENLRARWVFSGERDEMSMSVDSVTINEKRTEHPKRLRFLFPENQDNAVDILARRLAELSYITAERVGPREIYSLEDRHAALVVGPTGEHTVSVLHRGRDSEVTSGLLLEGAPSTRLRQVEERMRAFFPGFGLDVQQVPQTNAITLGIRTSPDTDYHRPVHVGFGLTQVLPIVVAALSSKSGDLLLIENPEVHLHPSGQAKMGEFLAQVAQAGVQVLVESHSDHVLSGIRRSVKAKQLSAEKVAIHFFRPRAEGQTQVISPQIDGAGNIDNWPEGFFDQFDRDTNHFAGWE